MFQRKSRHINEVNHTIYACILIPHQQMKDASMSPWKVVFVQCFRVKSGCNHQIYHYTDVIMTTITSQITSLTVVYSTIYSDADQREHQSSASLSFVWGIHQDRWIPAQRASYAENVSIWWRHHVVVSQHGIAMTSEGARLRPKSTASRLFTQPFVQAQIKETSKLRVTEL